MCGPGSSSFPAPNASSILGSDGSLSPSSWGHMAPACLAPLAPTAFRFYGRTSCHSRVIHFRTNSSPLISYFTTGKGQAGIPFGPYTLYSDHTAIYIPQQHNAPVSDLGEYAMTYHVLGVWGSGHWNIRMWDNSNTFIRW